VHRAITVGLAVAGLAAVLPAPAAPEPVAAETTDRAAVARSALDATLGGDYDAFAALADATVRGALERESFAAIAASLEFQFGTRGEVTGVERSARDGFDVFVFTIDYERAAVKIMVALDAEARVAGLRIVGVDPKIAWQPPGYADPTSFVEEEVTVGAEGFPLPGTLSLPKREGRHPAVVLLHGSGPNDRDETLGPNKVFKDLAWGLASRGVAVLRYEKRTREHAQRFDAARATLDSEVVDDAVAALAFLRARPGIDGERLFVVGHSLGGFAAPFVARADAKLAGIAVLEGGGEPVLDIVAGQIEYLAKLGGQWNAEAEAEVGRIREVARRGRAGEDVAGESILGVPAPYWIDLDRRDAPAAAAEVGIPVLVVQGGRDYQTTPASFERWKAALDGKPFASFAWFADLNHLLMRGEGPPNPQEYQKIGHVDERVLTAIVDWIGSCPGRKRSE